MVESKSISEQLAEFNKTLDDLANIEVNMEDEDKALLLLCSLPKSFENFKDTILYGKEGTTTLEEVQSALRTKELTKFKDLKVDEGGEGLNVARGRSEHRGKGKGSRGPSLGPRVFTNQSINAFFVTNKVTSRRIARIKGAMVVLPFKLRWRPMKMVMRVQMH